MKNGRGGEILLFQEKSRGGIVLAFGKKKTDTEPARREIPVLAAAADPGLTAAQAAERAEAGWANAAVTPPSRTVG